MLIKHLCERFVGRLTLVVLGGLALLLIQGGIHDQWYVNLCALSTLRLSFPQGIVVPYSNNCHLQMPENLTRQARALRLLGRRAMLLGEDEDGIRQLEGSLALDPANPFAHLWLAELYHRRMDAVAAVREYSWLAQHLADTPYGLFRQAGLDSKLEHNQDLMALEEGMRLLQVGQFASAQASLTALIARSPKHTLARYYLFLAYRSQGNREAAQALLPDLRYFEYGEDERLVPLLNDALPEMALPLIEVGYWRASEIGQVASWLSWKGDRLNSQRLLNSSINHWPNDPLLAATRAEQMWRDQGNRLLCSGSSESGPIRPWTISCVQTVEAEPAQVEQTLVQTIARELGVVPNQVELGRNLLQEADLSLDHPGGWTVHVSVIYDDRTSRWVRHPDFFPDSGLEPAGFCGDKTSIRLQILWDRRGDRTLFSGVSQAVKLPEPGLYAVSTCYLSDDGMLEVSVNQAGQILAAQQRPATGQSRGLVVQLLQVTQVDQPVYVVPNLYGGGRAWVSRVALQKVRILPLP